MHNTLQLLTYPFMSVLCACICHASHSKKALSHMITHANDFSNPCMMVDMKKTCTVLPGWGHDLKSGKHAYNFDAFMHAHAVLMGPYRC